MNTFIISTRIILIVICIVLLGILLTDGDISKFTLFIQFITLSLLILILCKLFRRI